jgi:hypothetical protein
MALGSLRAATILALLAQTPGAAVSVPFVGCASSGQLEVLAAPKGTSKYVPISTKDAHSLAYYQSADGIGLLAPRGWYCEGASGSSGYVLFLSPKPIRDTASGWEGLDGAAIVINHITGENSGRYEVEEIVARVFPEYRAFASKVFEGIDLPLPSGPYPKDTLNYSAKMVVEYKTPAQTEGLGNFNSWLEKNDTPIAGAAILLGVPGDVQEPPDLLLLSVRLPPAMARLTPVIVRYFERGW